MEYKIIIPYFSLGAQGNELHYAVEGWRRHFKEPYRIVIVGDYNKVVETGGDIIYIACPRIEGVPGMYRPNIDSLHKVMTAYETLRCEGEFVLANDDMYALRDFTIEDLRLLKCNAQAIRTGASGTGWSAANYRTRQLLEREGLPVVNYSTHLPYLYEWDKFVEMVDKYDLRHNDYIRESLYYNTYGKGTPLLLDNDTDNIRLGVWRSEWTLREITERAQNKIWLVNAEDGWNLTLNDFLRNAYN